MLITRLPSHPDRKINPQPARKVNVCRVHHSKTFEPFGFLHVWVVYRARQGLKVKVRGQGRGSVLELAIKGMAR